MYLILKGTTVRITTSNGGAIVAVLLENYRRSYDAVIEVANGYAVIPFSRISTIDAYATIGAWTGANLFSPSSNGVNPDNGVIT